MSGPDGHVTCANTLVFLIVSSALGNNMHTAYLEFLAMLATQIRQSAAFRGRQYLWCLSQRTVVCMAHSETEFYTWWGNCSDQIDESWGVVDD
eukprot:m.24986 g.24986  ORF g.24986 m.24986 type:complete len:93 (+) comp7662_c0_seq2:417-695(+)